MLFDAFKRVNEQENATIQGTGLGLAITKELTELMQGKISVDSELGKGSTFHVRIPQKIKTAAPIGAFHQKTESRREAYQESVRAPDARILIVVIH